MKADIETTEIQNNDCQEVTYLEIFDYMEKMSESVDIDIIKDRILSIFGIVNNEIKNLDLFMDLVSNRRYSLDFHEALCCLLGNLSQNESSEENIFLTMTKCFMLTYRIYINLTEGFFVEDSLRLLGELDNKESFFYQCNNDPVVNIIMNNLFNRIDSRIFLSHQSTNRTPAPLELGKNLFWEIYNDLKIKFDAILCIAGTDQKVDKMTALYDQLILKTIENLAEQGILIVSDIKINSVPQGTIYYRRIDQDEFRIYQFSSNKNNFAIIVDMVNECKETEKVIKELVKEAAKESKLDNKVMTERIHKRYHSIARRYFIKSMMAIDVAEINVKNEPTHTNALAKLRLQSSPIQFETTDETFKAIVEKAAEIIKSSKDNSVKVLSPELEAHKIFRHVSETLFYKKPLNVDAIHPEFHNLTSLIYNIMSRMLGQVHIPDRNHNKASIEEELPPLLYDNDIMPQSSDEPKKKVDKDPQHTHQLIILRDRPNLDLTNTETNKCEFKVASLRSKIKNKNNEEESTKFLLLKKEYDNILFICKIMKSIIGDVEYAEYDFLNSARLDLINKFDNTDKSLNTLLKIGLKLSDDHQLSPFYLIGCFLKFVTDFYNNKIAKRTQKDSLNVYLKFLSRLEVGLVQIKNLLEKLVRDTDHPRKKERDDVTRSLDKFLQIVKKKQSQLIEEEKLRKMRVSAFGNTDDNEKEANKRKSKKSIKKLSADSSKKNAPGKKKPGKSKPAKPTINKRQSNGQNQSTAENKKDALSEIADCRATFFASSPKITKISSVSLNDLSKMRSINFSSSALISSGDNSTEIERYYIMMYLEALDSHSYLICCEALAYLIDINLGLYEKNKNLYCLFNPENITNRQYYLSDDHFAAIAASQRASLLDGNLLSKDLDSATNKAVQYYQLYRKCLSIDGEEKLNRVTEAKAKTI